MASKKISLLLSDVDGTLVDSKKRISARAKAAIEKVHEAGIKFAVTSGRAPRGMKMIVEQVKLSGPFAAFNGGMFVEPDTMKVLNSLRFHHETAKAVIDRIESFDLQVWVYADVEWYLRNFDTPHWPGGADGTIPAEGKSQKGRVLILDIKLSTAQWNV